MLYSYGWETRYLALTGGHTFRIPKVVRRIFVSKRESIIIIIIIITIIIIILGRKLHNKKLLYLGWCKIMKSRRMGWAEDVARMVRKGIYTEYWLESQKERPLGSPRRRRTDNIKMDLR
jgi:hypothetical protein